MSLQNIVQNLVVRLYIFFSKPFCVNLILIGLLLQKNNAQTPASRIERV